MPTETAMKNPAVFIYTQFAKTNQNKPRQEITTRGHFANTAGNFHPILISVIEQNLTGKLPLNCLVSKKASMVVGSVGTSLPADECLRERLNFLQTLSVCLLPSFVYLF